jgi:hypothetical protein
MAIIRSAAPIVTSTGELQGLCARLMGLEPRSSDREQWRGLLSIGSGPMAAAIGSERADMRDRDTETRKSLI